MKKYADDTFWVYMYSLVLWRRFIGQMSDDDANITSFFQVIMFLVRPSNVIMAVSWYQ